MEGHADHEFWGLRSKSRSKSRTLSLAEKWTLVEAKSRGGSANSGLAGSQQLLAEIGGQNSRVQH